MNKSRWFGLVLCLLSLILSGCLPSGNVEADDGDESSEIEDKQPEKTAIDVTPYAEEVGLSLETPTEVAGDVETTLEIKGRIAKADELNDSYLWVVLEKTDSIDGINRDQFEYYIPIKDGKFSRQVNLHHGEGDYDVVIRLPSQASDEEDIYYDGVLFSVTNHADGIAREVEYAKYGMTQDLELTSPVQGWNKAEETILIEGTLADQYEGEFMLAEIEKDGKTSEVLIPIEAHAFSEELPLSFGEGLHFIQLRLLADDKSDRFYESASFYVNNESTKELADIQYHTNYFDTGINLETPGRDISMLQDDMAYPVKGTIDKHAPDADQISHIIMKVDHIEKEEESTYVIPVEDGKFEGIVYFRFGPGEYEVTLNIPAEEQDEPAAFYFSSILAIQHEVTNIENEQDLLPSRGIESDHQTIIHQAEDITSGMNDDREKAKAIYEFVSHHVTYDVEKAENDIFNIDDSALTTLHSGMGICQDYAFLATGLLRAIGIEAHFVEGYAGERHAWVEAKIDGEWIEMDPTWGAGYIQNGEFHPDYNEAYFDPDPEFLDETHTREGIMY